MGEITFSQAVSLNGDLSKLLTGGQAAAKTATDAARSVAGATALAAQASAAAADAKLDAIDAATAASGHAETAVNAATIAADHASDASTSAGQASAAATAATTAAATIAKGQPNGTAALDSSSRLPAASYAIHPGQVLDAAAAAFASIPGAAWGPFLGTISDASAGDGTYTAAYVYPYARPNGRLWRMLHDYLTTAPTLGPGLSADAATTTLNAIWVAAASITD